MNGEQKGGRREEEREKEREKKQRKRRRMVLVHIKTKSTLHSTCSLLSFGLDCTALWVHCLNFAIHARQVMWVGGGRGEEMIPNSVLLDSIIHSSSSPWPHFWSFMCCQPARCSWCFCKASVGVQHVVGLYSWKKEKR